MSDTTNVLLIVDYCGEADPGLYLIPDAPEWLRACDGLDLSDIGLVRSIDISNAICEDPSNYIENCPLAGGEWVQYKIETGSPVDIGRATIIRVQVTP